MEFFFRNLKTPPDTSKSEKIPISSWSFLTKICLTAEWSCIKAWMTLNFARIPPLTAELAALERLPKTTYKLVSTLVPSFLFGSSSFLQVTRTTI